MSDGSPLPLRIERGRPTPEEVAAVIAVLAVAIDEQTEDRPRAREVAPSAWSRTQRPLRRELRPGPGRWRGFEG